MLNKLRLVQGLVLPMTGVLVFPGCSGGISSTVSVTTGSGADAKVLSGVALNTTYGELVCAQNSSCTLSPTKLGSPITNAVATGLPAGLSISSSGVISGTPTQVVAGKSYNLTLTCRDGTVGTVTVRITVTLPVAAADHVVLVSGNGQSGYPGSALSQLRVQVQDQYNQPWSGGVTLGLMRMLGIDNTGYAASVTTDSNGYASFPVSFGYSPSAWQVVPMGSSLPNLSGATCTAGNSNGLSCGTTMGFRATPTPLGTGTFGTRADYISNAGYAVAVGNFNGDAYLDMAVVTQNALTMTILSGVGDGTFPTWVDFSTVSSARGVAVGDFNRDGKLDVAVATTSPAVSIFIGNGNGSFKTKVDYALLGSTGEGLVVGDFNGDGKLDVAATGNNLVQVFIGNGDGTFMSEANYPAGSGAALLTSGDFNGDGKLDVAVADSGTSFVSVLLGNGDGSFSTKADYSTANLPRGVTTGDFNGDGKLDLATTSNSGNVSVLLGNGNGTFGSTVNYFGGITWEIAVGDYNGDGKLDLAGVASGSTAMKLIFGNGDGTFTAATSYATGNQPRGIASGDFNGDGKLDLAVGSWQNNTTGVFLGN